MCVDHTGLNTACPKDNFAQARIDQLIDATTNTRLLSFLDAYSGYHQVPHPREGEEKTAFPRTLDGRQTRSR